MFEIEMHVSIFDHQANLAREETAYQLSPKTQIQISAARQTLLSRRLHEQEGIKPTRTTAIDIQIEIFRIPPCNPFLIKNNANQELRRQKEGLLAEIICSNGFNPYEIAREAFQSIAIEAYIEQQDLDLSFTNNHKVETLAVFWKLQETIERANEYGIDQEEIESAAQPILEIRRIEKRVAKIKELTPMYQRLLTLREKLNTEFAESLASKDPYIHAKRIQIIELRDSLSRLINPYFFSSHWKITRNDLLSDFEDSPVI